MQSVRAAEKADPLYGRTAARELVEGGQRTRNVRRRIQRLVESGDFTQEEIAKKIRPDLEKLGLITLPAEDDASTTETIGVGETEKAAVPRTERSDPTLDPIIENGTSTSDTVVDSEPKEKEAVPSIEKSDPIIDSIKNLIRRVADVVCDPERRKIAAAKVRRNTVKRHAATMKKARKKKLDERGMFSWTPEYDAYFKRLLNDDKYLRPISKKTKTRRYNHTALCWEMNAKFKTMRFDEDVTRNKLDSLHAQAKRENKERQGGGEEKEEPNL